MTRPMIVALIAISTLPAVAAAQPAPKPALVGQITIVGNDITQDSVIRGALGVYPGEKLSYPALRKAEKNLVKLNLFEVDPKTKTGPTITVLDDPKMNETKDILVQIKETSTGCYRLTLGIDGRGPSLSVLFEERNFDIFCVPTGWADIYNGKVFRGGGEKLEAELLRINLLPCRVSFLPRSFFVPAQTVCEKPR